MIRSFRERGLGETTARVRLRMAGARPFEDSFTGNLHRKLACGALRPEIANLVRAELALRGEPEDLGREFPIEIASVPGWRFRIGEKTSNGVYLVEGRDDFGGS